jgi:hypothetical protein
MGKKMRRLVLFSAMGGRWDGGEADRWASHGHKRMADKFRKEMGAHGLSTDTSRLVTSHELTMGAPSSRPGRRG